MIVCYRSHRCCIALTDVASTIGGEHFQKRSESSSLSEDIYLLLKIYCASTHNTGNRKHGADVKAYRIS